MASQLASRSLGYVNNCASRRFAVVGGYRSADLRKLCRKLDTKKIQLHDSIFEIFRTCLLPEVAHWTMWLGPGYASSYSFE